MREIIQKEILYYIKKLQKDGYLKDCEIPNIEIERPKDMSHGDWTTNIGFVGAKLFGISPADVTAIIAKNIKINGVSSIIPVGGYINFTLSKSNKIEVLQKICEEMDDYGKSNIWEGKSVMVEYTDPNPFKVFHVGHLMPNVIGESVASLFEFSGADVFRVNYQGDVGLHVAKALWGIKDNIQNFPKDEDSLSCKTEFLGKCYAKGAEMYEKDELAKSEIIKINKSVYNQDDDNLMKLYAEGRMWSLEHFEEIYDLLGTRFDHYFFESETWKIGKKIVEDNIGTVFEKSEGAIIFDGEKYGLHKRVFISREGLTTYEAKDIGLAEAKRRYHDSDVIISVTAVEQKPYFEVIFKALELLDNSYKNKLKHVSHGLLQLKTGKMSSRTGNVISGESLLEEAKDIAKQKVQEKLSKETQEESINAVAVAGIKFSILKQSLDKNIIYDNEQALSFDGDSGPYLQYTYARIQSVLRKAEIKNIEIDFKSPSEETTNIEKLFPIFPEKIIISTKEQAPHHIANYLLELAHEFNSFYANNKIISDDDNTSSYKLAVSKATGHILKNGLNVLGIKTLDIM